MKLIKPFRGLRPSRVLAAEVASHPYDVLNRSEAYELAKDKPHSFLHINKPEVDIDEAVDVHDPSVYDKGRENLDRFIEEGTLQRDDEEMFYVYKQVMGTHEQIGLVAVASIDAYETNHIKKHEFTRPDKEDDRVFHMDALNAQVGPVFLTYKADDDVDRLMAQVVETTPEYDFEAEDGTQHTFWVVEDVALSANIEAAFADISTLYVADGHHRSAAAARVRHLHQERNPDHSGDESYNFFLVVLFPDDQVQILDYNRVVQDLQGASATDFQASLEANFHVEPSDLENAKPGKAGEFGFYTDGQWYKLRANANLLAGIDNQDPVKRLDVSILQDSIFTLLLGIEDQRTDKRVDFVGGIRGLQELQKRVDSGQWQAAFALYPTSIESLMAIADADEVMPPKSTWFEPKLKSGLIVHMLD
jgi:uncharacterized protein (DUF1015 family)